MTCAYCFLVAWQDQPPSHITDEELALVINTCWCLLHAHYGFIEPVCVPLSALSPAWLESVGSFHWRVTCGIRMTIKGYLRHMENLSSSYLAHHEKIYLVDDMCGIWSKSISKYSCKRRSLRSKQIGKMWSHISMLQLPWFQLFSFKDFLTILALYFYTHCSKCHANLMNRWSLNFFFQKILNDRILGNTLWGYM